MKLPELQAKAKGHISHVGHDLGPHYGFNYSFCKTLEKVVKAFSGIIEVGDLSPHC